METTIYQKLLIGKYPERILAINRCSGEFDYFQYSDWLLKISFNISDLSSFSWSSKNCLKIHVAENVHIGKVFINIPNKLKGIKHFWYSDKICYPSCSTVLATFWSQVTCRQYVKFDIKCQKVCSSHGEWN